MNKRYLQQRQKDLLKELERISQQLEVIESGFHCDRDKAFKDYTVNEMQELATISEKAYKYLNQHKEETALDYNCTVPKDDRIIFAD